MESLGSEAARRRLPELLHRAEQGESTVINRRGAPVAALVPIHQSPVRTNPGLLNLRGSGQHCWGAKVSEAIEHLRQEWC